MNKQRKFIMSMLALLVAVAAISNTAWAANDTGEVEPRLMWIRTPVEYIPDYTSTDYTYKHVGFVSGDNRSGSSPLQLSYTYESSGTVTASFSEYASASAEASVIFGTVSAEIGAELTFSRSWTKGSASGATYSVPPGEFVRMDVYIPAVKTEGQIKYRVHADGYENSWFYEYETLGRASYVPYKDSINYKIVNP